MDDYKPRERPMPEWRLGVRRDHLLTEITRERAPRRRAARVSLSWHERRTMFLRIRASMAGMKWPLRSSSRRVWLAAALIGLLAAGGGLALAYNEKVSPDRYVPQGAERQWGEFIGRTPQQILN